MTWLLSACGDGFTAGPVGATSLNMGSSSPRPSGSLNMAYQAQALAILQTNCATCHFATSGPSNIYGFNDVNHLTSSGLVVPGSLNQSMLYVAVSASLMPPGAPLAAADQQVLANWIAGPAAATPTPTPTPGPNVNGTYTYIQQNIVGKCVACHANFNTYDGLKAEVVAGSAMTSLLYTKINTGEMPQGGPFLSVEQIRAVYDWIQAGAMNN
jgi:mono/diheme cytochrome c family protein